MATGKENPIIAPLSEKVLKAMMDSMRGVIPFIRSNFVFTGSVSVTDLERSGAGVQMTISAENQELTVVSLPPKSSYHIGRVETDTEILPYDSSADKPAVIVDVTKPGIYGDIKSLRQLGGGLTLQSVESYSIRTRDRAATVIIKKSVQ